MAGPGAISSTIVWGTRYHSISYLFGFFVAIALFALCCWGLFRIKTVAGTGFTPDRHQRDYAYYGAIADGIGD